MERISEDGGLCWALHGDFSSLPWLDAYDRATAAIARHYAYTTHRAIDWSTIIERYRPRVESAASNEDKQAFFLAMIDLIGETKDGHCSVEPESDEMKARLLNLECAPTLTRSRPRRPLWKD